MNAYEKLAVLCHDAITRLHEVTPQHHKRLSLELKEINAQEESAYFLNLYEQKTIRKNENNLLVPHLLGICKEFDLNRDPAFLYGDSPDVDIDYIPVVREYLKEVFSREKYGEDFVCNIATYSTFGLRSALLDAARVLGYDHHEVLALTTKLGIKDDEGETLTWEKALELYDDLRTFVEENPEIGMAVKKLLHRIRNMGVHASGLIVSGVPIKDFIPLVRASKSDQACSAWVEGLHGTDLGNVGCVKFDFLGLEANNKIADACRLVKLYYNQDHVSALPGESNWTDTSYLDDPKCLEVANKGDLKMIFQYDGSPGIRHLAKQGGVTSFNDLVAYVSIFRPAILRVGMHDTYCNRKNGKEEYEIHPTLKPILEFTYGVFVYQEQVMRVLNVVGGIPLKDCETLRKAISKKKTEKFLQYKKQFIANGQEVLKWTPEQVEDLWKQLEASSYYNFNLSHGVAYTYISSRMLYLKVHYPLAFYASVFSHVKATGPKDYLKLKEYRLDAERHGVKIRKVDINKSQKDFAIVSESGHGEIYYGFAKIKEIGEKAAERLVELRPYASYDDFLTRFGTDAKVNQAVLALRLFKGIPIELYNLYETRKKQFLKRRTWDNRDYQGQIVKLRQEPWTDKIQKKIDTIQKKIESGPQLNVSYEENVQFLKLLRNPDKAEEEYYGFVWSHPIEKVPGYSELTFEKFEEEKNKVGPVEVQVRSFTERQGPRATYYSLEVEDALGTIQRINVWKDDQERFVEKFKKGNFLRIRVQEPTNGFRTYSLASYPRWSKPPKEYDTRVFVLNTTSSI